ATDPAGATYSATYSPANPLVRISQNCNVAAVTFTQGVISQYPQGLTNDQVGDLYLSADNSVWRIAPITPPARDAPSVYMDNPGVFNAASNLIAFAYDPPPCFKNCARSGNDSVTGNEILRITGSCMGSLEPAQASFAEGRLPTSLQGTRVLFDGEAAPLLSVQATEILAIAPQDVAAKSRVTMTVENQGVPASAVLNAAAATPGIFVSTGKQAAAINEDGSLNGTDQP